MFIKVYEMANAKKEGVENYENWSNFLTKGTKNEFANRWQVFEELQNVKAAKANDPDSKSSRSVWREYMGEVLIEMMNLTDPNELSELLVLNGYIDLKGFIKIGATLGMERDAAIAKYESLMLELRS